jgi:hypothetical protein
MVFRAQSGHILKSYWFYSRLRGIADNRLSAITLKPDKSQTPFLSCFWPYSLIGSKTRSAAKPQMRHLFRHGSNHAYPVDTQRS